MKSVTIFLIFVIAVAASAELSYAYANQGRIIGGGDASRQEFKFAVNIRRDGKHYCSGSIVDKDWILTSGHCVTSLASSYLVVAGAYDLSNPDGNEQMRNVSHIILHPDYKKKFAGQNDIALMLLSSSLEFDAYVQPVILRPASSGPTPIATVIGWGQTDKVLQKLNVPLVSDTTCRNIYGHDVESELMICYGETGKDACQGDSGGALLCGGQLCGIVSAGRGCGQFPSIYTYAPYYSENFITEYAQRFREDNWPVYQSRVCGGVIDATSGYIEISSLLSDRTCIWTARVGRTQTRVRALSGSLTGGVAIHMTPYHHEGPDDYSTQITNIGQDYYLQGAPMFFITLDSGNGISTPVILEFYSSDLYSQPVQFTHFEFLPNSPKFVSYPGNGENYRDNENSIFILQNEQATTVDFTRVNMDGFWPTFCVNDFLRLYDWTGTKFNHSMTLCGSPAVPISSGPGSVFIAIFTSDGLNTYAGFDFMSN